MNRNLCLAALPLLTALAGHASAQPAQQAQQAQPAQPAAGGSVGTTSDLRRFLEQIERVLVTRRQAQAPIAIQGGGSLVVSGMGAFEPGLESQRLLGLRVELELASLEPGERVVYLDLHEIESLLRGMASLQLVAAEGGRGLETEARIVTVEGFGLGVWVHEGAIHYQIRWGPGSRVLGRLSAENFATLQDQIETARDRLFNAGPAE